jgi:sialic acid synthase
MWPSSAGPSRWEELDLRVIPSYRDAFPDTVIGFSSHDPGAAASIAAFALGARVIEKHFTLDRTLPGSDHAFSLEPVALSGLVTELRQVREALGSPAKRRHPSERPALHKMGKKLVVRRDLEPGERLSAEDLASQSPGDGLAPYHLERLVGQRVTRRLRAGEAVTFDAFSVCAPSRSAARR